MGGFEEQKKPLAGTCRHDWQDQESPYVVAQVCTLCKLFRYKVSVTADWEYRAPIPFGRTGASLRGFDPVELSVQE